MMLDSVWHSMADEHVNLAVHVSPLSDNDVLRPLSGVCVWPFGSSVLKHHGQPRLAIGTAGPGLPSGEASCA